jgi:XTP/dITP diphosphohydrolase
MAPPARRRILIATTNPGKIREIRGILADAPVDLVTLADLPAIPEPDENGTTFADNARLKALYYAAATGLPSVADDSGIEIDALDKAPGIHSARWHGFDYPVKFRKIYELLAEKGLATSAARFVAAVAFAENGRVTFESRGVVEGTIAPEPRGSHGFGYDPIFFYPPLGCTLGEVHGQEKEGVSHRGAAFRPFRDYLVRESRESARPAGRSSAR